ncbi:MAG: DUF1059 domain-containing protein [Candidatus Nitrosocosmicus sp.]
MFSLKCADAGFDCDYAVEANSEEEIISKVKEHGRNVHNLHENEFSPDLVNKIRATIKQN